MGRYCAATLAVMGFALGAHAHAPARPSCLAEYRSPEWLVAASPLILVGSIEQVSDDPGEKKPHLAESEHAAPPTIARVKVLELLKGRYDRPEVRVGSGPIRSCAPWAV